MKSIKTLWALIVGAWKWMVRLSYLTDTLRAAQELERAIWVMIAMSILAYPLGLVIQALVWQLMLNLNLTPEMHRFLGVVRALAFHLGLFGPCIGTFFVLLFSINVRRCFTLLGPCACVNCGYDVLYLVMVGKRTCPECGCAVRVRSQLSESDSQNLEKQRQRLNHAQGYATGAFIAYLFCGTAVVFLLIPKFIPSYLLRIVTISTGDPANLGVLCGWLLTSMSLVYLGFVVKGVCQEIERVLTDVEPQDKEQYA